MGDLSDFGIIMPIGIRAFSAFVCGAIVALSTCKCSFLFFEFVTPPGCECSLFF